MRVRTYDRRSGHDGVATGGSYGPYSYLIASRPGLVREVSRQDKSTSQSGHRLNYHRNAVEVEWEVDEAALRPGDFVLLVEDYAANPYFREYRPRDPKITLIAGEMPEEFPPDRYRRALQEWRARREEWEAARARAALQFVLSRDPEGFRQWDRQACWYWEPSQERKALMYLRRRLGEEAGYASFAEYMGFSFPDFGEEKPKRDYVVLR